MDDQDYSTHINYWINAETARRWVDTLSQWIIEVLGEWFLEFVAAAILGWLLRYLRRRFGLHIKNWLTLLQKFCFSQFVRYRRHIIVAWEYVNYFIAKSGTSLTGWIKYVKRLYIPRIVLRSGNVVPILVLLITAIFLSQIKPVQPPKSVSENNSLITMSSEEESPLADLTQTPARGVGIAMIPSTTPTKMDIPTETPTSEPTAIPTEKPTSEPTAIPTENDGQNLVHVEKPKYFLFVPQEGDRVAKINTDVLNVRLRPNADNDSDVFSEVRKGELYYIVGRNEDCGWLLVDMQSIIWSSNYQDLEKKYLNGSLTDFSLGWISNNNTKFTNSYASCESIPINQPELFLADSTDTFSSLDNLLILEDPQKQEDKLKREEERKEQRKKWEKIPFSPLLEKSLLRQDFEDITLNREYDNATIIFNDKDNNILDATSPSEFMDNVTAISQPNWKQLTLQSLEISD